MMLFRSFYSLLSPSGAKAKLSVFIFHRVLAEADPMLSDEPDVHQFDQMLKWIGSDFNVLPADEAVACLRSGTLPARSATITFDDGYADNFTQALPVLQNHGLSAAFFIATGYLDGGRMWNDTVTEAVRRFPGAELNLDDLGLGQHAAVTLPEKAATRDRLLKRLKYLPWVERLELCRRIGERVGASLPDDLMLRSDQALALRHAGMVIGAHTVDHPILSTLPPEEVRRQIGDSRCYLEDLLGERVGLFAYPNGRLGKDYRPEDVEIVREMGFDAAFTTAWGVARNGGDPFQIPRFTPWDRVAWRFKLRLVENMVQSGKPD